MLILFSHGQRHCFYSSAAKLFNLSLSPKSCWRLQSGLCTWHRTQRYAPHCFVWQILQSHHEQQCCCEQDCKEAGDRLQLRGVIVSVLAQGLANAKGVFAGQVCSVSIVVELIFHDPPLNPIAATCRTKSSMLRASTAHCIATSQQAWKM